MLIAVALLGCSAKEGEQTARWFSGFDVYHVVQRGQAETYAAEAKVIASAGNSLAALRNAAVAELTRVGFFADMNAWLILVERGVQSWCRAQLKSYSRSELRAEGLRAMTTAELSWFVRDRLMAVHEAGFHCYTVGDVGEYNYASKTGYRFGLRGVVGKMHAVNVEAAKIQADESLNILWRLEWSVRYLQSYRIMLQDNALLCAGKSFEDIASEQCRRELDYIRGKHGNVVEIKNGRVRLRLKWETS